MLAAGKMDLVGWQWNLIEFAYDVNHFHLRREPMTKALERDVEKTPRKVFERELRWTDFFQVFLVVRSTL